MRKSHKLRTAPSAASSRVTRRTGLFTVAALSLILAACGDRHLSTMDPESPIAEKLDTMLVWLLIASAVVFVLVQGAVLYMAKRFRVKAPEDESQVYPDEEFPEQVHGNTRLEIGWTILPTVIMAVVAFFTLGLLFQLDDVDADPDNRIESVTVVGQQWWWEFHYTLHGMDTPGPHIVTAGELVLPQNEEVQLYTTSRDVIHSFWIPTLNGKRDAVPGRLNPWTIEASNIGRYPGECTEFCGLSHAYMEKFVVSVSEADWDTWAALQQQAVVAPAEGTPEHEGWLVFNNQCASCHVINGLTAHSDPDTTDDVDVFDTFALYAPDERGIPERYIDKQTQVAGAAPNLTHFQSRSTFAGGVFELYKNPDAPYLTLAESGVVNRGALEAWIINAPEQKANAWDSPSGGRGMTPFETLSAEDVDNLVEFLTNMEYAEAN